MFHLMNSSEADPERLQSLNNSIEELIQMSNEYRDLVFKEQTYYKKIKNSCKEELEFIEVMEVIDKKKAEELKKTITAVLSADYQMSKLLPSWGDSSQPGETYFLRKFMMEVMGITFSATYFGGVEYDMKSSIYIVDERQAGKKSSDQTIFFIDHYVQVVLRKWYRDVNLWMDNAGNNKNRYVFAYICELVANNEFESVRVSFMVPGHTKFDVDNLFARIAHTYSKSDVFSIEDLVNIATRFALTFHREAQDVCYWKKSIKTKYSKLNNIKKFRDFLFTNKSDVSVSVRMKECVYDGDYDEIEDFITKTGEKLSPETYLTSNRTSKLSTEKINDLKKQLKHIPEERRMFIQSLIDDNDQFIDPKLWKKLEKKEEELLKHEKRVERLLRQLRKEAERKRRRIENSKTLNQTKNQKTFDLVKGLGQLHVVNGIVIVYYVLPFLTVNEVNKICILSKAWYYLSCNYFGSLLDEIVTFFEPEDLWVDQFEDYDADEFEWVNKIDWYSNIDDFYGDSDDWYDSIDGWSDDIDTFGAKNKVGDILKSLSTTMTLKTAKKYFENKDI